MHRVSIMGLIEWLIPDSEQREHFLDWVALLLRGERPEGHWAFMGSPDAAMELVGILRKLLVRVRHATTERLINRRQQWNDVLVYRRFRRNTSGHIAHSIRRILRLGIPCIVVAERFHEWPPSFNVAVRYSDERFSVEDGDEAAFAAALADRAVTEHAVKPYTVTVPPEEANWFDALRNGELWPGETAVPLGDVATAYRARFGKRNVEAELRLMGFEVKQLRRFGRRKCVVLGDVTKPMPTMVSRAAALIT